MKATRKENFRVEVWPRPGPSFLSRPHSNEEEEQTCKEIHEGIKRHVDHVGLVRIEADEVVTCEHCGAKWDDPGSAHNGGCCDKDMAEIEADETKGQ